MRARGLVFAFGLGMLVLVPRDAPADDRRADATAVSVEIRGHGEIRVIVSEGTARPCESSDNHLLFRGHAAAGDAIQLTTRVGSVCVDHTYGTFRESQWAGGSIWSAGDYGPHPGPQAVLHIPVPTDSP
jgi:hypothetical protein